MASPLLRNLLGDFHNLRGRRSRTIDQNLKAPKFDPDSTLFKGTRPEHRKLRPRLERGDAFSDSVGFQSSAQNSGHSLTDRISDSKDKSKPLPPLSSRFPSPKGTKKSKKRKLPRAVTGRELPQQRSRLHLSATPDHDPPVADNAAPSRTLRLTSPFDNVPFSVAPLKSQADALKLSEDVTTLAKHPADHGTLIEAFSDPQASTNFGKPPIDNQIAKQPSAWLAKARDRQITDNRQLFLSRDSANLHVQSKYESEEIPGYDEHKECKPVVETIEGEPTVGCGHVSGFHSTQQAIWDCIDKQWDDGKTISPCHSLPSFPQQALQAGDRASQTGSPPLISPPPSFRRSSARTSRLERSLTSVFSTPVPSTPRMAFATRISPTDLLTPTISPPRAPLMSPLTPQMSREVSSSCGANLSAKTPSPTQAKQLQRSPTRASLGFQSPSGSCEKAIINAQAQPLRLSRLASLTDIQPLLGLPAPVCSSPSLVTKNAKYLNPDFTDAVSKTQDKANTDSRDFFTTYYDAMAHGTEHSWTLALCNSNLGDSAIADALLSDLPKALLTNNLQPRAIITKAHSGDLPSNLEASQRDGPSADPPSVYTFGSTASTRLVAVRRSSRGRLDGTSPTKKTVLQGRELRELELLSPIREEYESQSSLLPSGRKSFGTTSQGSPTSHQSPNEDLMPEQDDNTYETTQCDHCHNARRCRSSKQQIPPKCDKLLPSCSQCTAADKQCSYRGQPVVLTSAKTEPTSPQPKPAAPETAPATPQPAQLSMAHRQRLLVHILATAGSVYQPFAQIYYRYRAHARAPLAAEHDAHLTLGHALDAVMHTARAVMLLVAAEIVDASGVPMHPDGVAEYYGKLALVLASVWALESATAAAEEEGGAMLRLKTSRDARHVEFVNRVFEVLAAFGAEKAEGGGGGAVLGVLEACVAQVDDAMWRLWEQMEGGLDETGQVMGTEIHWDIMVEVSKEVLGRGFVDASRLDGVRRAVEKVASFAWMQN